MAALHCPCGRFDRDGGRAGFGLGPGENDEAFGRGRENQDGLAVDFHAVGVGIAGECGAAKGETVAQGNHRRHADRRRAIRGGGHIHERRDGCPGSCCQQDAALRRGEGSASGAVGGNRLFAAQMDFQTGREPAIHAQHRESSRLACHHLGRKHDGHGRCCAAGRRLLAARGCQNSTSEVEPSSASETAKQRWRPLAKHEAVRICGAVFINHPGGRRRWSGVLGRAIPRRGGPPRPRWADVRRARGRTIRRASHRWRC